MIARLVTDYVEIAGLWQRGITVRLLQSWTLGELGKALPCSLSSA